MCQMTSDPAIIEHAQPNHGRIVLRWLGIAAVIVLIIAAITFAYLTFTRPYAFHAARFEPAPPVPDLALTNQDGQIVRLRDYRGNLVLLFFGYTHCPDACPLTLGIWKQVQKNLGADAEPVRFVFVTVDPERDTPERLKQYLARFNSAFVGLTGTPAEIQRATRAFGVHFQKEEIETAAGYLMSHTAGTFVIDREGRLVLLFPLNADSADIAADLKYLLSKR